MKNKINIKDLLAYRKVNPTTQVDSNILRGARLSAIKGAVKDKEFFKVTNGGCLIKIKKPIK